MPNFSNMNVTNILLTLIAGLLLILVIQNQNKTGSNMHGALKPLDRPGMMPSMSMQEEQEQTSSMSDKDDFSPLDMASSAFVCPGESSLTLSNPECNNKQAQERKKTIQQAFTKNLPISRVFDLMVKKYGEDALVPKAREIRRQKNRSAG